MSKGNKLSYLSVFNTYKWLIRIYGEELSKLSHEEELITTISNAKKLYVEGINKGF
jgi:hypothetical protein